MCKVCGKDHECKTCANKHTIPCPKCKGKPYDPATGKEICSVCDGDGHVWCPEPGCGDTFNDYGK